MGQPDPDLPFHVFRFHVTFSGDPLPGTGAGSDEVVLCHGSFSEVSGLEATMEPKVIRCGGFNTGEVQRMGPISHATVVLKRGMTRARDMHTWFRTVGGGGYDLRLRVRIAMLDHAGKERLAWVLRRAMPVKFKAADLSATGSEIGVEELHLVHEGLELEQAAAPAAGGAA